MLQHRQEGMEEAGWMWNVRRRWIFQQPKDALKFDWGVPQVDLKQSEQRRQIHEQLVSIERLSSLPARMEALKVAVTVQKDVLSVIETGSLQRLRRKMEEPAETSPTLAEQTRYVRLQALVKVLEELIPMELRLLDWVQGLPQNTPDNFLNDLQKSLQELERTTNRIPNDWETSGQIPEHREDSTIVSVELVTLTTSLSPKTLERQIALLHSAVEGILSAVSRMLALVMRSDVNVTSTSPCDVTPADISLLYLQLPQTYIIEN